MVLIAVRAAGAAALRAARRRGRLTERAVIVGAGPAGEQLAGLLREHPELGLRATGSTSCASVADLAGLRRGGTGPAGSSSAGS